MPEARVELTEDICICSRPASGMELIGSEDGFRLAFTQTEEEKQAARTVIEASSSRAAQSWFAKHEATETKTEALRRAGPWLVCPRTGEARNACTGGEYNVHDDRQLFVRFLRLDGNEEIVEFASRYGFLRGETCSLIQDGHPQPRYWQNAEAVAEWEHEIAMMRMAWELWELLGQGKREPNEAALKKRVIWRKNGRLFFVMTETETDSSEKFRLYPIRVRPEWLDRFETAPPARSLLEEIVGNALSRHVQPLSLSLGGKVVAVEALTPRNLLGALWLQFYWMILGRTRLVSCLYCGRTFIATTPRDLYCKETRDSCKAKATQVRRLAKDGESVEQIARKKGLTTHRVRAILS